MRFSATTVISLCALGAHLNLATAAAAELSAQAILDRAYGPYDPKHQCWMTEDEESGQRYCMKIDRTDNIAADTGPRFYLLAAGEAVDLDGKANGGHATAGMVGAFVAEQRNGKTEIIAHSPKLPVGANGSPPAGWKLVQLGPEDYWGWQNTAGDCHQGYCGARYLILAPYGKKVREIASLVQSFDDAGACTDEACEEHTTALDSTLEIDTRQDGAKVFPLLITVTGQ